jgi:hypothetical protein
MLCPEKNPFDHVGNVLLLSMIAERELPAQELIELSKPAEIPSRTYLSSVSDRVRTVQGDGV